MGNVLLLPMNHHKLGSIIILRKRSITKEATKRDIKFRSTNRMHFLSKGEKGEGDGEKFTLF